MNPTDLMYREINDLAAKWEPTTTHGFHGFLGLNVGYAPQTNGDTNKVAPPALCWFINLIHCSYLMLFAYHKPKGDIEVMDAPTNRDFVSTTPLCI